MISINRFVHEGQSLTIGRNLHEWDMLDKDDITIPCFDNAERQAPPMMDGDPVKTFGDLRLPLTEDQIKIEAKRCLGCGKSVVDVNMCIGCGLCTTRCNFDAIHLRRDVPGGADMHTAEEMMACAEAHGQDREARDLRPRREEGPEAVPGDQRLLIHRPNCTYPSIVRIERPPASSLRHRGFFCLFCDHTGATFSSCFPIRFR